MQFGKKRCVHEQVVKEHLVYLYAAPNPLTRSVSPTAGGGVPDRGLCGQQADRPVAP
jgi:hypothetical protein